MSKSEEVAEFFEAPEGPYDDYMRVFWDQDEKQWVYQYHPCAFPGDQDPKDYGRLTDRAYCRLIEAYNLEDVQNELPANVIQFMSPDELAYLGNKNIAR
jgi:hypothetical protein